MTPARNRGALEWKGVEETGSVVGRRRRRPIGGEALVAHKGPARKLFKNVCLQASQGGDQGLRVQEMCAESEEKGDGVKSAEKFSEDPHLVNFVRRVDGGAAGPLSLSPLWKRICWLSLFGFVRQAVFVFFLYFFSTSFLKISKALLFRLFSPHFFLKKAEHFSKGAGSEFVLRMGLLQPVGTRLLAAAGGGCLLLAAWKAHKMTSIFYSNRVLMNPRFYATCLMLLCRCSTLEKKKTLSPVAALSPLLALASDNLNWFLRINLTGAAFWGVVAVLRGLPVALLWGAVCLHLVYSALALFTIPAQMLVEGEETGGRGADPEEEREGEEPSSRGRFGSCEENDRKKKKPSPFLNLIEESVFEWERGGGERARGSWAFVLDFLGGKRGGKEDEEVKFARFEISEFPFGPPLTERSCLERFCLFQSKLNEESHSGEGGGIKRDAAKDAEIGGEERVDPLRILSICMRQILWLGAQYGSSKTVAVPLSSSDYSLSSPDIAPLLPFDHERRVSSAAAEEDHPGEGEGPGGYAGEKTRDPEQEVNPMDEEGSAEGASLEVLAEEREGGEGRDEEYDFEGVDNLEAVWGAVGLSGSGYRSVIDLEDTRALLGPGRQTRKRQKRIRECGVVCEQLQQEQRDEETGDRMAVSLSLEVNSDPERFCDLLTDKYGQLCFAGPSIQSAWLSDLDCCEKREVPEGVCDPDVSTMIFELWAETQIWRLGSETGESVGRRLLAADVGHRIGGSFYIATRWHDEDPLSRSVLPGFVLALAEGEFLRQQCGVRFLDFGQNAAGKWEMGTWKNALASRIRNSDFLPEFRSLRNERGLLGSVCRGKGYDAGNTFIENPLFSAASLGNAAFTAGSHEVLLKRIQSKDLWGVDEVAKLGSPEDRRARQKRADKEKQRELQKKRLKRRI
uniref:Uncharacterized protein n=1 Tax=Chromera velia CCMP2878 TaxID=1169474 RepID=A0A0G4IEL5_9ALVE|eukprot:Cvel_2411.t1-p1 / transcript=Cvel_2411.t1 / gene=Cvel_2411 / organism=Chromera_velia_CCMP2878 / gene_product=hypothetical protein / transcript_product=hypothetical protein / location=Cvel_scaffold94:37936-42330(+) / protein_length=906 / sequence_SO=supercontig / SO=protein_coding / is_pseudo=false